MIELKPCPFCGKDTATQFSLEHTVECWSCNAHGPRDENGDHRAAWNRRAQGLSHEDRAALQGTLNVLDRARICADGPCSKCRRAIDVSRKDIAAILRRMGGQTT